MKPAREQDPRHLDVLRLAAAGGQLQGSWPVESFGRLAAPGATDRPPVQWALTGEQRPVAAGEPESWLHLRASASIVLTCQRCLQPMVQPLEVDRRIRFVRDEATAEQLDEESEDDVLALPRRLDVHELLEDELILALPLVPRHDDCPQPLHLPQELPAGTAPSPFAALARLRDRGPDAGPDAAAQGDAPPGADPSR